MKTMIRRTALTSIAILFLLGGTTAVFADQSGQYNYSTNQAQTLNATMIGGVSNLGTQVYSVKGGQVAFAAIAGQMLDPTTATIQYNLFATQSGFTTRGSASVLLSGSTTDGVPVSVNGQFKIADNVPIATFGQSELPFFFLGTSSSVQITIGGATQTLPETLQVESPYFNPFGAPIVLASTDGAIVIAATYTEGTIVWAGTKVGGSLVGTLGTTTASGQFNMTTGEVENLVKGTAVDAGTISFTSMTPSSLNAKGFYGGTSTIPTTGGLDCSAALGIPGLTGVCTQTGFQSSGRFLMSGMTGTYSTTWGVPALGFSSSVTATVSQYGNR
jgi:hypothetical protein